MEEADWESELGGKDVSNAWNTFRRSITHAVNKHAPRLKLVRKQSPAWISQETVGKARAKWAAWKKWKTYWTRNLLKDSRSHKRRQPQQ